MRGTRFNSKVQLAKTVRSQAHHNVMLVYDHWSLAKLKGTQYTYLIVPFYHRDLALVGALANDLLGCLGPRSKEILPRSAPEVTSKG